MSDEQLVFITNYDSTGPSNQERPRRRMEFFTIQENMKPAMKQHLQRYNEEARAFNARIDAEQKKPKITLAEVQRKAENLKKHTESIARDQLIRLAQKMAESGPKTQIEESKHNPVLQYDPFGKKWEYV